MRERFQSPFPMLFVQYHLQGGARRFGVIAVGYAVICLLALLGYRRAESGRTWVYVAGNALTTLAFAQGVIAIMVGSNMIHRALARDHQTRMSESHRLSPMSSVAVVMGYLIGGPLQALMLFGMNVLIGAVLATIAAAPLGAFFGGTALLLCSALTVWALAVFWGVGLTKPVSPVGPLMGLIFTGKMFLIFMPGVALLFGIYSAAVGLSLVAGTGSPGAQALGLIALANVVCIWFWVNAACARFRRPELPALNGLRGSVLLVLWLVFSTIGLVVYGRVSQTRQYSFLQEDVSSQAHWIMSLSAALLLAGIPIANACKLLHLIDTGTRARDSFDRVPDYALALILPLILCGLAALLGGPIWRPLIDILRQRTGEPFARMAWLAWGKTVLACLLACVTLMATLRMGMGRTKSVRSISLFVLLIACIGLPVADLAWAGYQAASAGEDMQLSALFGCSPVGTLILTWALKRPDATMGLVFQALLCAGSLVLMKVWRRPPVAQM